MANDADSAPSAPADEEGGSDGKPEGSSSSKQEGEKEKDKKPGATKDDSEARRDQFAAAIGDPLLGALGGASSRAGESQAYQSWLRTVRASGAAFVSGGSVGTLNITTFARAHDWREQKPGVVPRDVLNQLIEKYAPVDGLEILEQKLADDRLLVLRGAAGTGRGTTGLWLLDKVADDVARFNPQADLSSLRDTDFEPRTGYLLELQPAGTTPSPPPADVDRLRAVLAERDSYLVVIVAHDIRFRDAFEGCIADCPLPDPLVVLDRAVEFQIRRHPDRAAALREAAAAVRPYYARRVQTPAEVHWLVAQVASAGATDLDAAQLERLSSELLSRQVASWFEPLAALPATSKADEAVRLAGFRIALAVLNEAPFDLVAEVGEGLAETFLRARSPLRKPGRPVFAHCREDFVANSRAKLADGMVRFLTESAPAARVTYEDDRLPVAVLRHVWSVHNMRAPLLTWLEGLSEDRRPLVYVSATLTIGLLTSWDFSYTFHERIQPWAASDENPRRRWAAAVALDEAASNEAVLPVAREMLQTWCKSGTFAERWTAAIALGYEFGRRDPVKALKELRKLGRYEDGELAQLATWSVARIFAMGCVKPVIDALTAWLEDERRDVRWLSLICILRVSLMQVSDLESDFDLTAPSIGMHLYGKQSWPLVVAVADADPRLLDPLADLVWHLVRSRPADKQVTEMLTKWIRACEKDPACTAPVGRFLALIGDDDFDRTRLTHLVRALRLDPDDPLPLQLADRLRRAIENNIHIEAEVG